MATKASANQTVRNVLSMPATCLVRSGGITKENNREAARKPSTNFGNLSHIIDKPFPSVVASAEGFFFKVHQAAIKTAATPINTFWENFTITPAFIASGPTNCAAAVTDAVVSNVPPSHAPATISERSRCLIIYGININIGIATSNTSEVT